jgi:hypothetical protein
MFTMPIGCKAAWYASGAIARDDNEEEEEKEHRFGKS